jgi:hypothetical protein
MAEGVEAVAEAADFTVGAVVVVAGMAEAVGTMELLPMVAGLTHADLLVTP